MSDMSIKINDLPDEILIILLRKLSNVEVLYSLIGVNKRLNRIAHDSIFIKDLMLFERASNNSIHPLPHFILDRFLSEVLCEIHHKIEWLHLESTSMEKILLATTYPSLTGLALYGVDVEQVTSFFTNDTVFTNTSKTKMLSLILDVTQNKNCTSREEDLSAIIFTQVLTTFTNLQYLKLGPSIYWHQRLSFTNLLPSMFSSTLFELHVSVMNITDCLYLLDGRFLNLHTLHVNTLRAVSDALIVNNKEKSPNLRSFSLSCFIRLHVYDEVILQLLHRMFNLEKLDLNFKMNRSKGLVDANDLKKNIIDYMPRLKKFTFNIRSFSPLSTNINSLSNEDIQHRFKNCSENQIVCCIDHFAEKEYSCCHIYSYPYRFAYYDDITNNFSGGLFKFVVKISLFDERPFEHEFFLRIAQSFPFVRELTVNNNKPQQNKLHNDHKDIPVIKYPHLNTLRLISVHDDYIEQFLLDTKMSLPNNVDLSVEYQSLEKVTHHFKREATRANCAKANYMCRMYGYTHGFTNFQFPEHFENYFFRVCVDII